MQPADASAIPTTTLPIVAALSLVLLIAGAVAVIAGGLVWRLFRAVEGDQVKAQPVAKATVRFVRFVVFAVATVVLAFPALDFAGVDLKEIEELKAKGNAAVFDPKITKVIDAATRVDGLFDQVAIVQLRLLHDLLGERDHRAIALLANPDQRHPSSPVRPRE